MYIYIHHIIYINTLYCLFVSRVFRVFYPVERDEASIPGRESPSRLSCSAVPATELGGDRSMLQDTHIYIYVWLSQQSSSGKLSAEFKLDLAETE